MLVERHSDLLIHPRARGLTPRTVELYRQVGLEPAIQAASYARGDRFDWVSVRANTLADERYGAPGEPDEDHGWELASPSTFGPIDQDKLEILLRDKAKELGADVRFSTELTMFEQDHAGVTAVLRDRRTGAETVVRARYLIAADGNGSPVRHALGVGTDGPGPLFDTITAIVEADLEPALRGRRVSIAYLQRPRPFTILMAHGDSRWVFGTGYSPAHESLDDYTDDRVAGMVREASGLADVEVTLVPQIPRTDSKVLGFPVAAQVAQRFRDGRVFLVGDAAHAVPPTGGLGANTGIQDAHNLAWKLGAVLGDDAGPVLLDTYHDERHPVGLHTMEQALARFGPRMGPEQDAALIAYASLVFGYQYRSSSVLGASDDPTPLPPDRLTGQPGTRAPHVPVMRAGRTLSTLDLYGTGFVLLAGAQGDEWVSAADEASRGLGVPITAYRLGVDLGNAEAAARRGITGRGRCWSGPTDL